MKIIAMQSTRHLGAMLNVPNVDYTIKKFTDGEFSIILNHPVQNETVWIIASTQAPAETMLELFFLLDAVTHAGAQSINIFFAYFAYARQTEAQAPQARSAQVICNALKQFTLNQIYILHAHAANNLHTILDFKNVIDFDFFCAQAETVDIIVAPDAGATELAERVAEKSSKHFVALSKRRPEHEKVIIEKLHGNVNGKKVLIVDDMISTGRTIQAATQALKSAGAQSVSAAATHGLCNQDTYRNLTAVLDRLSVTNSIAQKNIPDVKIWDIHTFIARVIQRSPILSE